MDTEMSLTQKSETSCEPQASPEELFERFLRLSVADGAASPRTLETYREGFRLFIGWCAGLQISPASASFDDLEAFRTYLGGKFSPAAARLRLAAVKALYKALQRWGLRKDDPAAGLKTRAALRSASGVVLEKALSPRQAKLLLEALQSPQTKRGIRDSAIITLLLYHGLRVGEVAGLQLDSIREQNHALFVVGKGRKERTIQLAREAREALAAWAVARFSFTSESGALFVSTRANTGLTIRSIQRVVDSYLRPLGFKQPGRGAHALRHTHAVLATIGGVRAQTLAESLGHADIRTTDIYARAAHQYQENPSKCFSAAIAGAVKVE